VLVRLAAKLAVQLKVRLASCFGRKWACFIMIVYVFIQIVDLYCAAGCTAGSTAQGEARIMFWQGVGMFLS
jgi:hypothetical protein